MPRHLHHFPSVGTKCEALELGAEKEAKGSVDLSAAAFRENVALLILFPNEQRRRNRREMHALELAQIEAINGQRCEGDGAALLWVEAKKRWQCPNWSHCTARKKEETKHAHMPYSITPHWRPARRMKFWESVTLRKQRWIHICIY